jgi:hypothetical protein
MPCGPGLLAHSGGGTANLPMPRKQVTPHARTKVRGKSDGADASAAFGAVESSMMHISSHEPSRCFCCRRR